MSVDARLATALQDAEKSAQRFAMVALSRSQAERATDNERSIAALLSRHVTELHEAVQKYKAGGSQESATSAQRSLSSSEPLHKQLGHKKHPALRNVWLHSTLSPNVAEILKERVEKVLPGKLKVVRDPEHLFSADEDKSPRDAAGVKIYATTLLVVGGDPDWSLIITNRHAHKLLELRGAITNAQVLDTVLKEIRAGTRAVEQLRKQKDSKLNIQRVPIKTFFDDCFYYTKPADSPIDAVERTVRREMERFNLTIFDELMRDTIAHLAENKFMALEREEARKLSKTKKRKRDDKTQSTTTSSSDSE